MLGWYSQLMEDETKRLIQRLAKQTQVCVSFITLWSQNESFQSCQFLNRSLFLSLPMGMNLGYD